MAVEQPGDVAVRDHDALGPAGRARGVDHVGQARPVAPEARGRRPGVGFERRRGAHRGESGRRSGSRPRSLGPDQDLHARVLDHEGQPLPRVGGIERHVGAAGLEHARGCPPPARASAPGRGRRGSRGRRRARAGGGPAGWPGDSARRRSASRPSQVRAAASGARRACASKRPWSVEASGGCSPRPSPLGEELVPLGRRQQRQLRERAAPAPPRAAVSSRSKCPDQAVDRRGVEQIGVVLERADQPAVPSPRGRA